MKYSLLIIFILSIFSCEHIHQDENPYSKLIESSYTHIPTNNVAPELDDTIGINQQVGFNGDKYDLHTWVRANQNQIDSNTGFMTEIVVGDLSTWKPKKPEYYSYNNHVIGSFNEIKNSISTQFEIAKKVKEKIDAEHHIEDSIKRITDSSLDVLNSIIKQQK